MGSIVKSIGRAIKGIGKAIKKILPVLLMAAAIYVGYGYMTGFQSGGWPQIMNWGKSLINGITQGQSISEAATAAGDATGVIGADTAALGSELGAETAALDTGGVTATGLGIEEDVTAMPVGDVASTVAGGAEAMMAEAGEEAGADPSYFESMVEAGRQKLTALGDEVGVGWKDVTSGIINSLSDTGLVSTSHAAALPRTYQHSTNIPGIEVGTDTATVNQGADIAMSGTGPALETLKGPSYYSPTQMQSGNLVIEPPHVNDPTAMTKIAALGKKAWGIYKNMWADNPGMAMWTTSNVLKTILALLDDSAEKESYRRRHVAGFAPGGWDEVAKRYGGNLPGGRGGGRNYSTAGRRSMPIKTGPIPEANRSIASTINRQPAGIIGSQTQRTV